MSTPPQPAASPALEALSNDKLTCILAEHEQARTSAQGHRADLSFYRIEGFDFSSRELESVHFDDSLLIGCRFDGASLYGAVFSDTQAPGTSFRGATLVKAELFQSDLRGACFEGANLARAMFIGCNLSGASFRQADLSGAVLAECDLRGADMTGAVLTHASLRANQNEPHRTAGPLQMERPPTLIELAHTLTPSSAEAAELHAAWYIVLRGIEHLPFDQGELREILCALQQGRDYVLEELGFDFLDGRMRVSFLDDRAYCDPAALIRLLERLAHELHRSACGCRGRS